MATIQQELLSLIKQIDENQQHQLLNTARQMIQAPHDFEIFEAYSEEDIDDDAVYLCATERQIRLASIQHKED